MDDLVLRHEGPPRFSLDSSAVGGLDRDHSG